MTTPIGEPARTRILEALRRVDKEIDAACDAIRDGHPDDGVRRIEAAIRQKYFSLQMFPDAPVDGNSSVTFQEMYELFGRVLALLTAAARQKPGGARPKELIEALDRLLRDLRELAGRPWEDLDAESRDALDELIRDVAHAKKALEDGKPFHGAGASTFIWQFLDGVFDFEAGAVETWLGVMDYQLRHGLECLLRNPPAGDEAIEDLGLAVANKHYLRDYVHGDPGLPEPAPDAPGLPPLPPGHEYG
jgi:hypothetical protein